MASSVNDLPRFGSRPIVLLALLALSLSPACISSAHAQTAVPAGALQHRLEQKLEGLRRNAMDAWKKKDAATLKNIVAPDYQYISPDGVSSRDGWLATLSHCSVTAYSIDHAQLKSLTRDSALLILRLDGSGECNGTPFPLKSSTVTDTFVRRHGKWWIVNTVWTPMQKQAAVR